MQQARSKLSNRPDDRATRRRLVAEAHSQSVESLRETVAHHDAYTAEHCVRVAELSATVARLMGLSRSDTQVVRRAALLHDIGKVGVADAVLNKGGDLSKSEFDVVTLHPLLGATVLSRLPGMERLATIVLHHHERWDGTGYPSGLAGADIPIESRIIFVCDSFDAMTSERPYREPLAPQRALEEINSCAGTQFDPIVCEALQEAFDAGFVGTAPA